MSGGPPLADLVRAGEGEPRAIAVTDFVFMAQDLSNAYLVTTADGDVMVNTGFTASADRNRAALAPHRTGPLRAIVLTQSHPDHYGGLDAFRETGTQVLVQANFAGNVADWARLAPFYGARTRKLWGPIIGNGGAPPRWPDVRPDMVVDRDHAFELGGRRFEVIWTPDGETTDSLTVWMPDERIAFTGNLFGPMFLSMPFLSTLRGDKPRLVRDYLRSLERVRDLGAELLVTGHGEPIRGGDRVRADLDRMHAAVSWVRDYTFDGMCAGKDVHRLMREAKLPDAIAIGEGHGKVSWAVRSIWEQYAGWFHFDSTTALYGVPRSSVDGDIVELAGGPDRIAARAAARVRDGQPLEAIHLTDIVLGADPAHAAALRARRDALAQLLAASGEQNLSETMWLRSEIAEIDAKLVQ